MDKDEVFKKDLNINKQLVALDNNLSTLVME